MIPKIAFLVRSCEDDEGWEFYEEKDYYYDLKYSYEIKRIVYFEAPEES